LTGLSAHDVSAQPDVEPAKATLPDRHGLHNAEIILWGPPSVDTNPAMEGIGQPLMVLQLRSDRLGCRSRAAGHEDREYQQCGHPWWRHRSVPRLTLTLS